MDCGGAGQRKKLYYQHFHRGGVEIREFSRKTLISQDPRQLGGPQSFLLMRRDRGPDEKRVLVMRAGLAFADSDVGQQELAQRPQQGALGAIGIPTGNRAHNQAPFAQVPGPALFPGSALQFGPEDFWEVTSD